MIDGLTYKFDLTQPNKYDREGKLLIQMLVAFVTWLYQGKPIDLNQTLLVVTNNYRATENFLVLKMLQKNVSLNLENRQAIIDYIGSGGRLTGVPMEIGVSSPQYYECRYPFCPI